jgi:hypothetical protein
MKGSKHFDKQKSHPSNSLLHVFHLLQELHNINIDPCQIRFLAKTQIITILQLIHIIQLSCFGLQIYRYSLINIMQYYNKFLDGQHHYKIPIKWCRHSTFNNNETSETCTNAYSSDIKLYYWTKIMFCSCVLVMCVQAFAYMYNICF